MSAFISIRDQIDQVKKRVPPGTAIPSHSTINFAFSPPNIHSKSSQYYTGKVNLKHSIQRRQLRAHHTDLYYCSAMYTYGRWPSNIKTILSSYRVMIKPKLTLVNRDTYYQLVCVERYHLSH